MNAPFKAQNEDTAGFKAGDVARAARFSVAPMMDGTA